MTLTPIVVPIRNEAVTASYSVPIKTVVVTQYWSNIQTLTYSTGIICMLTDMPVFHTSSKHTKQDLNLVQLFLLFSNYFYCCKENFIDVDFRWYWIIKNVMEIWKTSGEIFIFMEKSVFQISWSLVERGVLGYILFWKNHVSLKY